MKLWCTLLAWFALSGLALAGEADGRFSQSVSAPERKESGLERLTSDQIAVLDALVRRDVNLRLNGRPETAPTEFSQRLSEDERRNTGLAQLPARDRARVDSIIERYEANLVNRTLLAPPVFVSPSRIVRPIETSKNGAAGREVHGEFSLSFGWGKGGYSERTGSMVVRVDDPEHNLSLAVGYSETRTKGPAVYRGNYYGDSYGTEIPRYSDTLNP